MREFIVVSTENKKLTNHCNTYEVYGIQRNRGQNITDGMT